MFVRSVILVLCAVAATGCFLVRDPEPSPAPDPVDLASPPPEGMSAEGSQYFGYAMPEDWESRPVGSHTGVVWEDPEGEVHVWKGTTTSMSAPDAPNEDVPELWATQPQFIEDDLTLEDSTEVDVPHADAAFRYDVTEPGGVGHTLFEVYATGPGKKLALWLVDTTPEEAETIGSTLIAVSEGGGENS